jgi:nitroimidazol reductase NimA-like FMN-containing flavoprotein (pyridoxamine 5'-phosphate oxidase superfamily)
LRTTKSKKTLDKKSVSFTDLEIKFLQNNEVCRVATVSRDKIPHVVPVCYVFLDNLIFFATDYDTKKYRNLKNNKNAGLVVDDYRPPNNKALVITGTADIIERGGDFTRIYKIFYEKFEWVRQNPWEQGEAPFVAVRVLRKTSWGF